VSGESSERRSEPSKEGNGADRLPGERPSQPTLPHVDTSPSPRKKAAPPVEEDELPADVYRVKLDVFEGPLDLLLHLIRKHELDILDIPVGFVTEKYLEYLSLMQELSIDVASEYLVMAATLAHIKSKMLLPPDPNAADDEEGEAGEEADPRAELVRRLLEYQKYRHAAEEIADRAAVGRDMFPRGSAEPMPEGPAPLASFEPFRLFDAFQKVLKRADQVADHQVLFERVSIADRIVELTELLHERRRLVFDELFEQVEEETGPRPPTRLELVVTFLALLEMGKMRVVRIVQEQALGPIVVELSAKRIDAHDRFDLIDAPEAALEPSVPPVPEPSEEVAVEPSEEGAVEPSEEVAVESFEDLAGEGIHGDVEPPADPVSEGIESAVEPFEAVASEPAGAVVSEPLEAVASEPAASAEDFVPAETPDEDALADEPPSEPSNVSDGPMSEDDAP
jgi:segregation and condensation protein A